jgi:hypothetical protein
MKRIFSAFTTLLCFTLVASAADVTGMWSAEMPGPMGTSQIVTFNLKADGAKLEGAVTSGSYAAVSTGPTGPVSIRPTTSPITEGEVDGDKISFTITRQTMNGEGMKVVYKGMVKGDMIEFSTENGRGPVKFTAKKLRFFDPKTGKPA